MFTLGSDSVGGGGGVSRGLGTAFQRTNHRGVEVWRVIPEEGIKCKGSFVLVVHVLIRPLG